MPASLGFDLGRRTDAPARSFPPAHAVRLVQVRFKRIGEGSGDVPSAPCFLQAEYPCSAIHTDSCRSSFDGR